MKKSIVWLASYPKSGNTWVRIFLSNYLMNRQEPMPINQVNQIGVGDSVARMYDLVAKGDLDKDDPLATLRLRGQVLRGIVANNADVNLVKTHNIRSSAFGTELIPANITRSAVYIMRNPLDMAVSYARHYGMTIDHAIESISRSDNITAADSGTVRQFLGSWTEHVNSWTSRSDYPVCVLRYEDMLDAPEENFTKLLEHLGVPVEADRLDRAIRFSSFDEVSKQEDEGGFKEKSFKAERFFVAGRAEQWRDSMTEEQIETVKSHHRSTMKYFGYL